MAPKASKAAGSTGGGGSKAAPKRKGGPKPPEPLDLPAAPVFHPTLEQWQDPLQYIAEVVR